MYDRKVIGLQGWQWKQGCQAELAENDFKTIIIGVLEDSEDRKSREMKVPDENRHI